MRFDDACVELPQGAARLLRLRRGILRGFAGILRRNLWSRSSTACGRTQRLRRLSMDRRSFRRLDLLRSLLLRLFVPFLFRDFLSRKISSAQVRVDGFEQFVEHGFGFGFL